MSRVMRSTARDRTRRLTRFASSHSDAISGVVNFILDKKFTGVKGEVSGGVTTYGDNRQWDINMAAGTSFANQAGTSLENKAGTTLTKDAPADSLTVSRARQVSLAGWKRPEKVKK